MIRVLLYTKDSKLRLLLSPALGCGFDVTSEPDTARVMDLVSGGCDVVLFDLDAAQFPVGDQVRLREETLGGNAAVVVLADDAGRPAGREDLRDQNGVESRV